MADVGGRVEVRRPADQAERRVGSVLQRRASVARVVEPVRHDALPPARELAEERVVGIDDEERLGQLGRQRRASARRCARARRSGRAGRGRGCRARPPSAARAARPPAAPPRRPRTGRARRRARRAGWRRPRRAGSRRSGCRRAGRRGSPRPSRSSSSCRSWRRQAPIRARAAPRAGRRHPGRRSRAAFPAGSYRRRGRRGGRARRRSGRRRPRDRAAPPQRIRRREIAPTCRLLNMIYHLLHAPEAPYEAIEGIDPDELASFQRAIRKRYSDEQILEELRAHAARVGRSPTMKEFAADPKTKVHPQTVIEHFGTWNAAKRAAGLVPRRFATREELLEVLRALGDGARPHADRTRPRRAPRPDAVEVALLAHLRLAERRTARGRLRRRRGGGEARAGARPGGGGGVRAPPAAQVRRLGQHFARSGRR